MNNIQVPKTLQKEYGNLSAGTKVKLPEMKKYVSHSKAPGVKEAMEAQEKDMKSQYFFDHFAFNVHLKKGCIDEIVDTETGNIIKREDMKKDGKYLKIWHIGYALPGNNYTKILEAKTATSAMIFILVPVDTTNEKILEVIEENGKKKEWDGWQFYMRLEGGLFRKIEDKELPSFVCEHMPRIDGMTRNLKKVNDRYIPHLPPKMYNDRIKSFMKRNIVEEKVQSFEEPNLGEEQSTSTTLEDTMADDLENLADYVEEQVEENGEEHEIQDLGGQEANGEEDPDEQEYTEQSIKSMDEEGEEEEEGEEVEEGEGEEEDSEPEPAPPTKVSKAPQKKSTVPPPPPAKKATVPPPQKKTTVTPVKSVAPPPKPAPLQEKAQPPPKSKAPVKEQPKAKTAPEKIAPPKKISPPENPSKTNGTTQKKSLKPEVAPAVAKNPSPDAAPKRKLSANEEEQLEAEEPPKKKTKAPSGSKSSKAVSENATEKKDEFGGPTGKKMWLQTKFAAASNTIYELHRERGDEYLKEIDPLEGKSFKEKSKWFRENILAFMHYENIPELKKIVTNKEPFQDLQSKKDFTTDHQKRIQNYGYLRYMLHEVFRCEHYSEEGDE